jgi:hypothetical protein
MNKNLLQSLSFVLLSSTALASAMPMEDDVPMNTSVIATVPHDVGKPLKIKTRDWGSDYGVVKKHFGEITEDKAKLANIRKDGSDKFLKLSAEGSVDMRAFLSEVDAQNKKYVSEVFDQEIHVMMNDPKFQALGMDANTFSIFTMGSMARSESGLYTDLEIFFVVKDKTILVQYMAEHLAQRLADRFFRLGEHPDVGGKGLRLDEAGNSPIIHLRFEWRHLNRDNLDKDMRKLIANRDFKKIPFEGTQEMLVTPEELASYHDAKYTDKVLSHATLEEKLAMKEKRKGALRQAYNALLELPEHADKRYRANGATPSEHEFEPDDELYKQLERYARTLFKRPGSKEAKHIEDLGSRLMRNVSPLYDNAGIFAEYWTKREEVLNGPAADSKKYASRRQEIGEKLMVSDGIKFFTDTYQDFNIAKGKLGDVIDLKRELYRVPEQILTNLGFYYGVGVQNVLDIVQKLNELQVFSDAFAKDVRDLMNFAMHMNIKQQAILKKQGFAIYISQDMYDADMKDLETNRLNIVRKIELLKISDRTSDKKTAEKIEEAQAELAQTIKDIHDLENVAPGKILTDNEVAQLSSKYIPMLAAFLEKAIEWSGVKGKDAFVDPLASLPSDRVDNQAVEAHEGVLIAPTIPQTPIAD